MANTGEAVYDVEMVTVQYPTVLELLLQQKMSKFRPYVSSEQRVGKAAGVINQIGVLQAKAPQPRYSPQVFSIPQYTRPWVFPIDHDLTVPVDNFDLLRSLIDPTSGINQAVVAAFNRWFDDVIIGAALSSFITGPDLTSQTTNAFDSTNDLVADTFQASGSTGLTYPKLVEAWRILRHFQNDMDAEMPCVAIGSQQEEDAKRQQEFNNKDYASRSLTEMGSVEGTKMGGFHVVVSERLQTSSSNSLRNCFAWVNSGLHFAIWKDMTVHIDNRVDLASRPWQLYAMATCGATRTQAHKVIQINCADTTGADPTAP
jgi:capsid protein